ncbi:DUF434 domain-containing protein [Methanolobus sp. WCC1]|jgi:hypothetical protein|uniref:DUF434 domain-containing protein n=1 Tax=unclassified Methanolobus TaxID=2629569 RepID=UPI00324651A6
MPESRYVIKNQNFGCKEKQRTKAADDIRYLLEKGYKRDSAIRFVADHYKLDKNERYILARTVFSDATASSRKQKKLDIGNLKKGNYLSTVTTCL